MLKRIAIIACATIMACPSASGASEIEGRWIRECGDEKFCRINIERTGRSTYAIQFMHTQPSTKGTILDKGGEPDPSICGWDDIMAARNDDGVATSGLTAHPRADGTLALSGIPSDCGGLGKSAIFYRDDVDEMGDI